jgi:hypothetical protein
VRYGIDETDEEYLDLRFQLEQHLLDVGTCRLVSSGFKRLP